MQCKVAIYVLRVGDDAKRWSGKFHETLLSLHKIHSHAMRVASSRCCRHFLAAVGFSIPGNFHWSWRGKRDCLPTQPLHEGLYNPRTGHRMACSEIVRKQKKTFSPKYWENLGCPLSVHPSFCIGGGGGWQMLELEPLQKLLDVACPFKDFPIFSFSLPCPFLVLFSLPNFMQMSSIQYLSPL